MYIHLCCGYCLPSNCGFCCLITLPSWVCDSLSISELYEDTCFSLFLVVVQKELCLPRNNHAKSLNRTSLPSLLCVTILLSDVHALLHNIVQIFRKVFHVHHQTLYVSTKINNYVCYN